MTSSDLKRPFRSKEPRPTRLARRDAPRSGVGPPDRDPNRYGDRSGAGREAGADKRSGVAEGWGLEAEIWGFSDLSP